MIVDYSPKVRALLQSALEDAGFQVVGASNTSEALEIMTHGRPDLISLDLVKSGIDGPKFIYQLRKDRANKTIPLLVMTSTSDEKDDTAAPEELMKSRILSGPGVYLKSPLTPGGYVKTIRDALNVDPSDVEILGENLKKQLLEKLEGSDPETVKKVLSEL